jgi:hypothetical protein
MYYREAYNKVKGYKMKNKITEHSKKLRIKTTTEWQKKKLDEGGYKLNVLITDKEIAEFARGIENKRKFVIDAIKEKMKKHA